MKKIVSITTLAGTMETFVLDSMIYMQQHDWNVTLMCNTTPHLLEKVPDGMTVVHIPMKRNFNLWTALKCIRKMVKLFHEINPDIVQYGTTHAALFGSIAAWLAHVPIRIHLQWGIYNYSAMGFKGKFYWFVEWLTCKLSTTIRPVSLKNLEVAVGEGLFKSEKGKVLGRGGTIGVDLSQYPIECKEKYRAEIRKKYNIFNDIYVYGFVGRLSKDKGNNELLKAFRRLSVNNNVALLLVGPDEGSVDKELMDWAKKSQRVILTGGVVHEDIPKYIASMDVLVHPTYREGFGMVLQEAMAMEVPIITTDIPGPSEVIEPGVCGILVPPQDDIALEEAMYLLCQDIAKAEQYGREGRKRVEACFNRRIMVNNIYIDKEELYSECINK